jgi:hypothetical protein
MGRSTQGVTLINLGEGEKLSGVQAVMDRDDEGESGNGAGGNGTGGNGASGNGENGSGASGNGASSEGTNGDTPPDGGIVH